MKKFFTILLLCLLCTVTSGQFFAPYQKPNIGLQIDGGKFLSNGLVGILLFNEGSGNKVFDLSGNGINLTFNGDPVWVAGKYGSALYCDANGDWADIGINAYNLGIRQHATFIIWFKPKDFTDGRHLISDYNSAKGFTLRCDQTTGAPVFYVYPNNHRIVGSTVCVANTDYMLAGVMDGANIYQYLNGKLNGTDTLGEDIGDSASRIHIGIRGDEDTPTTDCSNSDISQILIFDRALSASEIALLYREPFCFMQPSWNWLLYGAISVPAVGGGQIIYIFMD